MEHSPTLDQAQQCRSRLAAPRLSRGHFIMAVVLIALGYFLIWPVLLLLINSFNAANDWFVEPRRLGRQTLGKRLSTPRLGRLARAIRCSSGR